MFELWHPRNRRQTTPSRALTRVGKCCFGVNEGENVLDSSVFCLWPILTFATRAILAACLTLGWTIFSHGTQPLYGQGSTISVQNPCMLPAANLTHIRSSGAASPGITNDPHLNSDGTSVSFWSTHDLVEGSNTDGNIEVYLAQIERMDEDNFSNSRSITLTQITSSTGSILGGFNLAPTTAGQKLSNADNRRVTFFSDRDLVAGQNGDASFEVFLAELDRNGEPLITQITSSRNSASVFPTIDAGGRRVAFVSDANLAGPHGNTGSDGGNVEVFLAEVSANYEVRFTQITTQTESAASHEQAVISSRGDHVVFVRNGINGKQLYLWRAGASPVRISDPETSSENFSPVIAADGATIAHVAVRKDVQGTEFQQLYVARHDPVTNAWLQTPVAAEGNHDQPSISADGRRVAFVTETENGLREVLLAQVNGSSISAVTVASLPNGITEQPTISGDGTTIVYVGIEDIINNPDASGADLYAVECPTADLSLAVAGPESVAAGEFLTHTLSVFNAGPSLARDVNINYDLPSEIEFVSGRSSEACGRRSDTVTCALSASLSASSTQTLTVVTRAASGLPIGAVGHRFSVEGALVDPEIANNIRTATTQISQRADLVLTKSDAPISVKEQEPLTYTLTISNAGPSDATDVVVTDTLPISILDYDDDAFAAGGSCNPGVPVVCKFDSIEAGRQLTVVIPVRLATAIEAEVANEASASGAQPDPDLSNNADVEKTDANKVADLTVQKTGPATATAGTLITYTLTGQNLGPSISIEIDLVDELVPGLTFDSFSSDPECTLRDLGTVGCRIDELSRGQSASRTLVVTTSSALTTSVANAVTVQATTRDDTSGNNTSDPVITAFTTEADLALTMSGSSNNVQAGVNSPFTYTIAVANYGPSDAGHVVLTNTLPLSVTLVNAQVPSSPDPASCQPVGNLVRCAMGTIAAGSAPTATISLTVNPDANETITNRAEVTTSTDEMGPGGNTASITTDVNRPADLAVFKVGGPAVVVAGRDSVTYTIYVSNTVSADATGLRITDTLPAGLTYSSTVPNGACTGSGRQVSCGLGRLLTGQTSQAIHVIAAVAADAVPGAITNTVSVSSDMVDPDASNNHYHSAGSVTIERTIDLSITQKANPATPNIRDAVVFTVSVQNFGYSTGSDIVIRNSLPDELDFVEAESSQGTFSDTSELWSVGVLDSGATAHLVITATVKETAGGQLLSNEARLYLANETDGDGDNDRSNATIRVTHADLVVDKAVDVALPSVNSQIGYTISVSNAATSDLATRVLLSDTLPAGLTFRSGTVQLSPTSRYTISSDVLLWSIDSIPPGSTLNAAITGTVPLTDEIQNVTTAAVRIYTNTVAIVHTDQADLTPENNRASIPITVTSADLRLQQSAGNLTPNFVDTVQFTVTVTNDGPDLATNIRVRDLLPEQMRALGASSPDFSEGLWQISSLENSASATLVITAEFTTSLLAAAGITHTALISAVDQFDPDSVPGNLVEDEDDQQALVLSPQIADLSVTNRVGSNFLSVNDSALFTVTVANAGSDGATDVQLENSFAPQLALLTATASSGLFGTETITTDDLVTTTKLVWNLPSLAASVTETLWISASVEGSGTVTQSVQIMRADQFDSDSRAGNDQADEDDQADVVLTIGEAADLSLAITSTAPISASVRDLVTYTFTLENRGPDRAHQIDIRNVFSATYASPVVITRVLTTTAGNVFTPSTGIWHIESLQLNEIVELNIVVVVMKSDVITSVATIIAAEDGAGDLLYDPDIHSNNQAAVSMTVPQSADLEVRKDVSSQTTYDAGDIVEYSIRILNNGPDTATNIELSELLPDEMTLVAGVAFKGTYDEQSGVWALNALQSGSSALLKIQGQIELNAGSVVTNTAGNLRSDQYDWHTNNNTDTATINIRSADLSLAKAVTQVAADVGDTLVYTLTLTNTGPYSTSHVVVSDTFPSQIVNPVSVASAGVFTSASGIWRIDENIEVDEAVYLWITGTVAADTAGQLVVNRARITSTAVADPVVANNRAVVTTTVKHADLEVNKITDDSQPRESETFQYQIELTNQIGRAHV